MIVQKEIDREEVTEIANELIAGLNADIGSLQLEVLDHEGWIDALEADNPEALWGLTDTNFGSLPDIGKDQYTVKYDFTSD